MKTLMHIVVLSGVVALATAGMGCDSGSSKPKGTGEVTNAAPTFLSFPK